MAEPNVPNAETREQLLAMLAELVAIGGAAPLLCAPVEPGPAAFPEPWAATRSGATLLLRRLAAHAQLERAIVLDDRRAGKAAPTDEVPRTLLAAASVTRDDAHFALDALGEDDIAGTFAHEIGVAYAAVARGRGDEPYRSAEPPSIDVDPEVDLERGSVAAVYLGLGVLAVNAARQQHNVLQRQSYHPLFVAPTATFVEAGHLPMPALAYLVAVQAALRGDAGPPAGLETAQRAEVAAWLAALRPRAAELRARLAIASDARATPREPVVAFADAALVDDPAATKTAFRWHTHRGGIGLVGGVVLGVGVTVATMAGSAAPAIVLAGAAIGHVIGRRIAVPRCSSCATILRAGSERCPACGATLRGDITHLSERLEAEERLDDDA